MKALLSFAILSLGISANAYSQETHGITNSGITVSNNEIKQVQIIDGGHVGNIYAIEEGGLGHGGIVDGIGHAGLAKEGGGGIVDEGGISHA